METFSTKTRGGVTGEQPAGAPSTERKGGFIPGAVAAQGCCGTSGSGAGCCGEPAATTTVVRSAPTAAKPTAAPSAAQSGCCDSSASSCCG
ncbi:MAG TPA: hypothetical protein VGJ87_14850 [Roseiflexaceae bacterium]|jgi:hypothetical protein